MSDLIQETSEESFPASDPPAWNSLHIGPPIPKPSNQGDGTIDEDLRRLKQIVESEERASVASKNGSDQRKE